MKRHVSLLLITSISVSLMLGGCSKGGSDTPNTEFQAKIQTEIQTEPETGDQVIVQSGDKTASGQASENPSGESSSPASKSGVGSGLNTGSGGNKLTCQAAIHAGSLKGPISMGLISLMNRTSKDETSNIYEFTTAGKTDELVGKVANGNLDIALVPANVANVLHIKTQGNITVLDTNTLGVLYVAASDDSAISMAGSEGRIICMTGEGTTPEYVTNYFLKEGGLSTSDVDLQFKSEATEVASLLRQNSSIVGIPSQPFAAATCIRNPDLKTVLDLMEQWNTLNKGFESMLMTGVTLVCDNFPRENRSPVAGFIKGHEASILFAKEHVKDAVQPIAKQGTVEKASITQKALLYCNIVCLTGQEMKDALSGYLSTLNEQDPRSIGGQMPGDGFYYMPQPLIAEISFMNQPTNHNTRIRKYLIWLFWTAVQQAVNLLICSNIIFVGPLGMTKALAQQIAAPSFWATILNSFARISLGLPGAFFLSILPGSLAYLFPLVKKLLDSAMLLIRSVPVASLAILALTQTSSRNLVVFASFPVVVPMVYVSTPSGLEHTDKKLLEMARVFRMPTWKRIHYIYMPAFPPYPVNGCRTTLGMSWKSGVAAEVTGIPEGSVGEQLYYSKLYLDAASFFSRTFVVIVISAPFERFFLYLLREIEH